MLKKSYRQFLKLVLLVVVVIIFYFLVRKSGMENFIHVIKSLFFPLLLVALFFWVLNLMVSALRFKNIIVTKLRYLEILKIQLWGFLLNYGSFIQGLGWGAKVGLLKAKKVKITRSVAGVGSEIIYDVMFGVFISILFFAVYGKTIMLRFVSMGNLNIVLLVIALVVLMVVFFVFRSNKYFKELIKNMGRAFELKTFFKMFLLTSFVWLLAAAKTLFIFMAAGIDMNFFLVLCALGVGYVVGLITLIPGGLGVRESIWAYVYTLAGIPLSIAIPIAIIDRVFSIAALLLFVIFLELVSR